MLLSKMQKIPRVIKPFVFGKGNLSFRGEFDLAHLPQVNEIVTRESILTIMMHFALEEHHSIADVHIMFDAHVVCANCLENMIYQCDTKLHLIFTTTPDSVNSNRECIAVADIYAEFDTKEFIAQEVLLNLPMFIKHDYDCIGLQAYTNNSKDMYTQRPFAHLKNFIQRG